MTNLSNSQPMDITINDWTLSFKPFMFNVEVTFNGEFIGSFHTFDEAKKAAIRWINKQIAENIRLAAMYHYSLDLLELSVDCDINNTPSYRSFINYCEWVDFYMFLLSQVEQLEEEPSGLSVDDLRIMPLSEQINLPKQEQERLRIFTLLAHVRFYAHYTNGYSQNNASLLRYNLKHAVKAYIDAYGKRPTFLR